MPYVEAYECGFTADVVRSGWLLAFTFGGNPSDDEEPERFKFGVQLLELSLGLAQHSSPAQGPLTTPQSRSASQMLSTQSPRRVIIPVTSTKNDVVN